MLEIIERWKTYFNEILRKLNYKEKVLWNLKKFRAIFKFSEKCLEFPSHV